MITQRALDLQEQANAAMRHQAGSGQAAVLANCLMALKKAARRIDQATGALLVLPGERDGLPQTTAEKAALAALKATELASAVEVATSNQGERAITELEQAAEHLGREAEKRWRNLSEQCERLLSRDLVAAMATISFYRDVAERALELQAGLQRLLGGTDIPTPDRVRSALETREKLDEVLGRIQQSVPPSIQPLLRKCMSATGLPLASTTPAFLKWIREQDMEDTFFLRVR